MADVKLNNLVARPAAGIGDVDADSDRPIAGQLRGAGAEVGVFEGCVAQAIAEGIERLSFEVHIGASVSNVVIHHWRQLFEGARPCFHQPPAGVVIPEENLRQRRALILRRVRHVQNRGDVRLGPVDGEREAGDQNHNRLRIDGVDLLH